MQAKKRYILVFLCCAFLAYCYFGGYRLKRNTSDLEYIHSLPSFISQTHSSVLSSPHQQQHHDSLIYDVSGRLVNNGRQVGDRTGSNKLNDLSGNSEKSKKLSSASGCRMDNCFDYSRCLNNFLVYIYPPEPINSLGATPPISSNYQKIVTAIVESRYHTTDPTEACLFVLGIDTLDRDSLSDDYVRNVPMRVQRLPYWNNGKNHIIFNLYSGTWPDYSEQSLGFDAGYAILAKASMSIQQIRPGFDISIPLFHKQFPLRSGNTGFVNSNNFPANKKYLLAFKGKR